MPFSREVTNDAVGFKATGCAGLLLLGFFLFLIFLVGVCVGVGLW